MGIVQYDAIEPNRAQTADANLPPESLTPWANRSKVSNGEIWSEKDESI